MSKGNRKRRKKAGLLPTAKRCVARNRLGEPCKKYPVEGAVVCGSHGGAAPQVKRKAQERILMAQDDAASVLVRALSDDAISFAEKRKVAEYLLNFDTRNEVKVMLEPWRDDIEGLLVEVADDDPRDAEVVEGELVGTPPALPSPRPPAALMPSLLDDPPPYGRGNRLRGR